MNQAATQVLDEMVLGAHAKAMLAKLCINDMAAPLVAIYRHIGGGKMLDDFEPQVGDYFAAEMNLVRFALAQCDVGVKRQEELVKSTVRRIAAIFVGYVDKMSRGEPIDEEQAEFMKNRAKFEAAETPAEKLRAFADLLEGRSGGKSKYSA